MGRSEGGCSWRDAVVVDNGGGDQVNDNGSPRDIVRIGLCEETLVSDLLTVPNHRGRAYEFRQEVQRPISSFNQPVLLLPRLIIYILALIDCSLDSFIYEFCGQSCVEKLKTTCQSEN